MYNLYIIIIMQSYEDNELTIKTVQVVPIKTLISSLKDTFQETNIIFTRTGMKILNVDKSHNIVVNVQLSGGFELYECKQDKIIIGVDMGNLCKLLSIIDIHDVLTLYIEKCDYKDGVVSNLTIKGEKADAVQTLKLRLIEPDASEMYYPEITFPTVISMPSVEFQRIIHNYSIISDKLEIKSVGKQLLFYSSGKFADFQLDRSESVTTEFIKTQDSSMITYGVFSIKNLLAVIKCTALCTHVELHLHNNLPLVIQYDVATLGNIKFGIAQLPSTGQNIMS